MSEDSAEEDNAAASPVVEVHAKGKGRVQDHDPGPSNLHPAPPSLSRFVVERQLNELSEKAEDYISSLRKEVRKLGEDFLLDVALASLVAPVAGASTSKQHAAGTPESVMSPHITFKQREDFDSVVPISNATVIATLISCYKSRKASEMLIVPADMQLKKLLRTTWYSSLDSVDNRDDVKPFVFDRHGMPDLLPEDLRVPITKLCSYYPHCDKTLDGQAAWVHFVLEHLRAMAPKNGTDYSIVARTISEDLLVELLIKGPWETLKGGWRNQKKSDLVVARRGVQKSRHSRGRNAILFFHEGMQSGEESDPEDPSSTRTSIPEFQSGSREALPGHTFKPRVRNPESIPANTTPELKRGDQIMKIGLWAFSTQGKPKQPENEDENNTRNDDASNGYPVVPQRPSLGLEGEVRDGENSGNKKEGEGDDDDDEGAPMGGDHEFEDVADLLDEEAHKEIEIDPLAATIAQPNPRCIDPLAIDPALENASASVATKP
ncbi:hypothetical protein BDV93DRAFT_511373 [Ceratobasidium sp. AG-I]|nr:hypothetical protein BDV93DRAFT_511373 [Ceratobasidium sp. AG-I]